MSFKYREYLSTITYHLTTISIHIQTVSLLTTGHSRRRHKPEVNKENKVMHLHISAAEGVMVPPFISLFGILYFNDIFHHVCHAQ